MEIRNTLRELHNLYNSPTGKLVIEELGNFITDNAQSGISAEVLKGMCLLLAHIKELAKNERN
jgi:hypothetical protein